MDFSSYMSMNEIMDAEEDKVILMFVECIASTVNKEEAFRAAGWSFQRSRIEGHERHMLDYFVLGSTFP